MTAYFRLMRLDKPIGIYLLLYPTLWALFLAAGALERVIFDQILCRHIYHHTPADAPHIVRAHGFDAYAPFQ
jgi:hypothetical protein